MNIHTTTRAPRRSAEQQRRLIGRFERSGLGQSEFCRREGINVGTFYSWRRKHQEAAHPMALVNRDSGEESQRDGGAWLELPVGDLSRDGGGWDVELNLGEGITLRLSRR